MGYLSDFDGEISRFYEFQKNIDNITEESEKLIPKELQDDVLEIFNELHTFSTFVIASALLTQTGRVIISFLDSNILSEIIKLLEARFLIGNNKITELITLESFGVLSLVGIDSYISAIQFKHNSPFESALIISRKFSSRLQKIIC
jgi:hypothetical protein